MLWVLLLVLVEQLNFFETSNGSSGDTTIPSTPTNGMKIYNESSFSTVYSGNGNYFKIGVYSCFIDSLGNLSSPQICN